jgi:methanogenic corrinoid protein MtbC1
MDSSPTRGPGDGAPRNPWGLGENPPHLATFDASPRYDLPSVVHVLGVRRTTLLAWEQQLGMPAAGRVSDDDGGPRRYAERDLVALVWIRDRVVSGMPATEAVRQLLTAQDPSGAHAYVEESESKSVPYRPPINTQPLRARTFGPVSRPAPEVPPPPIGPVRAPGGLPFLTGIPAHGSELFVSLPSGPYAIGDMPEPVRRRTSGPESSNANSNLRALVRPLLNAFGALDTASAHEVMTEALSTFSVESVCVGLLQPAVNRIVDLWAHRQMTMPEERFALAYIRGFLYSHFHAAVERPDAPLVFIGCAPNESNDLSALMLATFWRQAGMRIIYLGPDVDGDQLVQEARARRPALIALTITVPQRVRALARIGRELQQLPAPRPIFAYGGPVFTRNPELQRKVNGVYVGDDVTTATWHVRRLLGIVRVATTDA